jgi:hypothetical protein
MTTYAFQVSMPVNDTLPRNRVVNSFHLDHVAGIVQPTDLEAICADLVELWQTKYANTGSEVLCKAYDTDAVPNYPRASVIVNTGVPFTTDSPREIALCLSYAGDYKGNRSERGRMYLMPQLNSAYTINSLRPSSGLLDWALGWYTTSNASLPDIGGIDWKFGVWSTKNKAFTQTTQAWVNDDWDVQRRRGLRESTRVQAQREG